MGFVANVPLKFTLLNGENVDVRPGERIPIAFQGQEHALPSLQLARQVSVMPDEIEDEPAPKRRSKGAA